MSFAHFIEADFKEGWLYELARGVIVVTEVPGPNHGRIVMQLWRLFGRYDDIHPGLIKYQAGGGECRLRLPGMASDRHPDQSIYLSQQPDDSLPWTRWTPDLVVEVLSKGSKKRDTVEKREEYLRVGVAEYWVIDPVKRQLIVHHRAGDIWEQETVTEDVVYRTYLLPGLEVRLVELLGPA